MVDLCVGVRLRCLDGCAVAAFAPARVPFVTFPVPTYRLRPLVWQDPSPRPAIRPRIFLASVASFHFLAMRRETAFFAPIEEAHVGVPHSRLQRWGLAWIVDGTLDWQELHEEADPGDVARCEDRRTTSRYSGSGVQD
jgi:hypothetical protein